MSATSSKSGMGRVKAVKQTSTLLELRHRLSWVSTSVNLSREWLPTLESPWLNHGPPVEPKHALLRELKLFVSGWPCYIIRLDSSVNFLQLQGARILRLRRLLSLLKAAPTRTTFVSEGQPVEMMVRATGRDREDHQQGYPFTVNGKEILGEFIAR